MRLLLLRAAARRAFSLASTLMALVVMAILASVFVLVSRDRVTTQAATAVMVEDLRRLSTANVLATTQGQPGMGATAWDFSRGVTPVLDVPLGTSRVVVVRHARSGDRLCQVVTGALASSPTCGVPEPTPTGSFTVTREPVLVDAVPRVALVYRVAPLFTQSWVVGGTGSSGMTSPTDASTTSGAEAVAIQLPDGRVETFTRADLASRDYTLSVVVDSSVATDDIELLAINGAGRVRANGSGGESGGTGPGMFSASTLSATVGQPISLASTGMLVAGQAPTAWNWKFGDGTFSSSPAPTKTFLTAGTYTVTLQLANSGGIVSLPVTRTIVVAPPAVPQQNVAPTAVLSANRVWTGLSQAVTFSAAGSADSDGTIISYRFVSGHGSSQTSTSPTFVASYRTAGTYTATLTTTDNSGATTTTSLVITVSAAAAPLSASRSTAVLSSTSSVRQAPVTLTVTARDANGTVLSNRAVTLTGPASLTFGSSTGTTNASGVFTTTVSGSSVGAQSLGVSIAGTTVAAPPTLQVILGAPTTLTATGPSTTTSGTTLSPVSIQLRESGGLAVPVAGTTVTAAIQSGGGALSGTTTAVSDASGVATFSSLTLSGSVGSRTLAFTAPSLTTATLTVALEAGAPASLVALGASGSGSVVAGSALAGSSRPRVRVEDAAGNPVSGATVTWSVASGPAGGTFASGATSTTDVTGLATMPAFTVSPTVGTTTIRATVGAVTRDQTVATIAGAAAALSFTTTPAASANLWSPLSQQPVIQVRDANGNAVAVAGLVVTAAKATGAGVLGGTLTAVTNASGVAAFTDLQIETGSGTHTLTFSVPSLTSVTSGAVMVINQATQLTVTGPSSSSSGATLGSVTVQVRDASGTALPYPGIAVTALHGLLSGTLSGVTDATGRVVFSDLVLTGTAGAKTLTFRSAGLSDASLLLTLGAGAATSLSITTAPSSAPSAGVVWATQPVIQLRDASGNAVSQSGVVVTASRATGSAALTGTLTASTNASGVATFTTLRLDGVAGSHTVSFAATGLTSVTSSPLSLTAGAASVLVLTTEPSDTVQSGVAFPRQPVAVLRDAFGNSVSAAGVVVTAAGMTGSSSTLAGTLTASTNASGVATFATLRLDGPIGMRQVVVSSPGLQSDTTALFRVIAGLPTTATLSTEPSSAAQAGVVFATQPVLQLRDAFGNAVSQSGVVITASRVSGSATLAGALTATTNAGGVATFSTLRLDGVPGNHILAFTPAGMTAVDAPAITLSAGPASAMTLITAPSASVQAGVAFPQQPTVQLVDAFGTAVQTAGVDIRARRNAGTAGLQGQTLVATNAAGRAVFSTLRFDGTVGSHQLRYESAGLPNLVGAAMTVVPGVPSALTITTDAPATTASGATISPAPAVQLRDAFGNEVSLAGESITASRTTGAAALSGTLSANTNSSGVATFSALSLAGLAGEAQVLTFTHGASSATAVSRSISLTAGAATTLAIDGGNSQTQTVGLALATAPRVRVTDAQGNAVIGTSVTFSVTSGGGSLTGGSVTTNASGLASVGSWTLGTTAGSSQRLTASSAGLTPSSVEFTATAVAGSAATIGVFSGNAQSGTVGTTLGAPLVVQVIDQYFNPVAGTSVTFTPAAGSVGTTTLSTNASGFASTTWTLGTTAGSQSVSVASTGLSGSPLSFTATATAGSAAALSLTTNVPATSAAGATLSPAPTVQLRDANGNAVSQAGVSITVSRTTGTGTLSGTLSANTNASGVATFSALTLSGTAGTSNTLTFASTGLTSIASQNTTLTAGAAATLAISAGNTQSATVGASVSTAPQVLIRDASNNPVSGVSVTFSVTTGGGSITGATTTTNSSGLASVGSWTLGTTAGSNSLTATSAGLTPSSVVFTATGTPGAATALALTGFPPGTTPSGVVLTPAATVQLRDVHNNPVATAGVTVTVSRTTGAGVLSGTTSATTDATGTASFGNLTLSGTAGTTNALTFASSGLTSVVAGGLTMVVGTPTALGLTTPPPASVGSGTGFTTHPVVQLFDNGGNAVSQSGVVVTASRTTGSGTLSGTLTATTNASGTATFSSLALAGTAGTTNVLTFTAPSVTSISTGTLTLTAGAPATLAINAGTAQTATVGANVATAPQVVVRDAQSNPVSGVSVTFSVTTGGGSITGATTTTNASGLATVGSWTMGATAGSNTLTASSAGLTPSSVVFSATGTPGAAAALSLTTAPASTTPSGATLSPSPVVQLRDAQGNAVSTSGVTVTVSRTTGAGTLAGTTSATTNGSGQATFSALSLSGAAGTTNVLTFASSGLTSVATGTLTMTAGTASALSITTQPGGTSAPLGAPFSPQPVIQLRDAFGNAVSQSGVTVTASVASGTGTLGGTLTASTNSSGVATFSNLQINTNAGNHTLAFSATSLAGATSSTIAVALSVSATNSTFSRTTALLTASTGSSATSLTVTIRNPSNQVMAGVPVTLLSTGSDNSFSPASGVTNGSGVFTATFSSTRAEAKTLSVVAGGVTLSTTQAVTVSAAGPVQMLLATGTIPTLVENQFIGGTYTLQMADQFGNPTAFANQNITAAVSGFPDAVFVFNSWFSTLQTDAQGRVSISSTSIQQLQGASGIYPIQFRINGAVPPSTINATVTTLRPTAPTLSCSVGNGGTVTRGQEVTCSATGGVAPSGSVTGYRLRVGGTAQVAGENMSWDWSSSTLQSGTVLAGQSIRFMATATGTISVQAQAISSGGGLGSLSSSYSLTASATGGLSSTLDFNSAQIICSNAGSGSALCIANGQESPFFNSGDAGGGNFYENSSYQYVRIRANPSAGTGYLTGAVWSSTTNQQVRVWRQSSASGVTWYFDRWQYNSSATYDSNWNLIGFSDDTYAWSYNVMSARTF